MELKLNSSVSGARTPVTGDSEHILTREIKAKATGIPPHASQNDYYLKLKKKKTVGILHTSVILAL